ncbi:MAG: hypothetical protein ACE5IF_03360 [Candidatus Bathyarchaeia archaeon]
MVSFRKTLFAFLVAIVVIAAVGLWSLKQPAGLVKFSIDRSVIKHGENATITVTVENFDKLTHNVEYRFRVNARVSIYEGAEKPLPRIGSQYTFNYTLEATIPSDTRVFVVIGSLEELVLSATYPISLTVFFDGEELEKTWSDLTLTVEE